MITGIHHVSILASGEGSIAFYEKLGFEVIFRKDRPRDIIVLMEGYGMQIELFIDPAHPKRASDPESVGMRHFALKVSDIEQTVCELNELSIESGKIGKDWTGIRYCYLEDPDGLPVELHE